MRIPVVDDLAWLAVRIVALVDAYLIEAIYRFKQPNSLKEQIEYMSRVHGGFYIALTPKEEIPEMVQEELTRQGRFILGLVAFLIVISRAMD